MAKKPPTSDPAETPEPLSPEITRPPGNLGSRMLEKFPWLTSRPAIAAQVTIQVILFFVIFLQVNYLGCRRYTRVDLSDERIYTLSDTTKNYASNLNKKVTMVMAFFSNTPLHGDVKNLLEEYDREGGDLLEVEYLDLSRDIRRLSELKDAYGIQFSTNTILVLTDDRTRAITAEELVNRDNTGRVIEFKGEEVLSSALLDVTENQQKRFYLVTGKRVSDELAPIARQLNSMVSLQNAQVEGLSLANVKVVPEDADAVILAGNTEDLSDREADILRDYLKREERGSLFVMLDPSAETPITDAIVRENGVSPRDDRVIALRGIGLIERNVPVTFFSDSGVTQNLAGIQTTLQGNTQSLDVAWQDDLLKSEGIHPRPIAAAVEGYWGESDYNAEEVAPNPDQDVTAPDYIFTAASVERGDLSDPDLAGKTSRLVIVGNPNLIDARGNTTKASVDFTLAALNWLVNRESLTGITPKKPTAWAINLTSDQFSAIQGFNIYLLPGIALLVGLFVGYRRRA